MPKQELKMTIVTTGAEDRCWQFCRCARCGTVERCTPNNDFYTSKGDYNGPLYCYGCLLQVNKEND